MAQRLCPVIVGREPELHALAAALESAVAGHGRSVLLVGEPGIGKSRLARAVADRAGAQQVPVVTGRAVPASASAAYRPVTEALLQLFRHRPLPDDPGLTPWMPLLAPLVPALVPDAVSVAEVSPSLRGEAVLQLVARVASPGLVVVLEDLHWADPDSVALIEYLSDNLAGLPVLLVATLRDSQASPALEVARRLRGRPEVTHLALDRLDHDQLVTMVRACDPDAGPDVISRVEEASEGMPLLVEELLASPGLPADFAATVDARLAALTREQREVVEAAAVLGRNFDWRLLPAVTGHDDDVVEAALEAGVAALLLASDGSALRFRHALTREAVLNTLIAPRQRHLATAALAALEGARPTLSGGDREVAVDLALRAGDSERAGRLLAESGRESLAWGALATAADALRRATDLLAGTTGERAAELALVETLALAGRVEEAAAAGARLVTRLGAGPATAAVRLEAHLQLAHAAIAAARWQMARHHLGEARRTQEARPTAGAAARIAVLEADVTMAADDHESARRLAGQVLDASDAAPEVRCHAFEIVGRTLRSVDLAGARSAFDQALVTAEAARLPVWRMRALHELGTVDLFDHAGVERLLQARQAAEQMGALGTAAVLDLQLCAAFHARWDLDACDRHATTAIAMAERLGLDQVRAKALAMLTGSAGMRADPEATERYAALTVAAGPEDRMLEAFCWAMRGMALVMAGDTAGALGPYGRGMAVFSELPHAEPAAVRALWPLVLASLGDRRAPAAVDEARRLGVAAFHLNRALIGYAEAVLAGGRGDRRRARDLVAQADTGWTNGAGWSDLARVLAAPAALAGGWADGREWLARATVGFSERGLPALGRRCQELMADASPNPWSAAGVTDREADVLRLVAAGLANKEIAAELRLSPRTVEKHVESLLRKTGARSRTELVGRLLPPPDAPRRAGWPAPTT